jgi:hypothetical protein
MSGDIKWQGVGWGCYEQGHVLPGFTRQRFPFCAVLEEGQALVYWDHDWVAGTCVAYALHPLILCR